jgi:hypothetical protein
VNSWLEVMGMTESNRQKSWSKSAKEAILFTRWT